MTLLRTIAILMAVALTGMALGTSHPSDRVPIVRTVRYGPPAYGGPPVDELVDQLDATRTAARIAQEAADAAEAQRVADAIQRAQRAVQVTSYGVTDPDPAHDDVWLALSVCEESGIWTNGGAGGLGFVGSWLPWGGGEFAPDAGQATPAQQITVARRIQSAVGWGAWPACTLRMGLR